MNKVLPLLLAPILLWAGATAAEVVREEIVHLANDGRHYTIYKTLRSDIPRRQLYLNADERVEDFVYIHPDDYKRERVDGRTLLTFDRGSYALMRTGEFSGDELERGPNNSYTFRSWNGKKLDNGHFGKWNSPEPFAHFSYVWLLPDNIEILEHKANRDGKWRRSGSTLAWAGEQVNDLAFTIRYRLKQPDLPVDLPRMVLRQPAGSGDVRRITLDSSVLFASGSHEITDAGKRILSDVADQLAAKNPERIIVEGHTDNQPLKPYLREKYPTNWELSAQRATVVVRWLARHGLDESTLEARALGSQRPVASNETAEGRARNRRIEILVSQTAPTAASQKQSDNREAEPSATPSGSQPAAQASPEEQQEARNRNSFRR